ncbi:MAG: hypothetical protein IKE70_06650 [Bacilli bacterium]|nr:hypothetical protein [Bacilli bacterium]
MKKIVITISIIGLILGISIGVFLLKKNSKKNPSVIHKDIHLVTLKEEINNQILFTNYEDYKKIVNDSKITKESFKDNNYYLFSISYNTCRESEIAPTSYKIKNKLIEIIVQYEAKCGYCAKNNLYYVLKVDNKLKEKEIVLKYQAINKVKCDQDIAYKPIIYLYPEKEQEIEVKLLKKENLWISYPKYEDSWKVLAKPDGTLRKNNREYYGLYWEGINHKKKQIKEGFIVRGEDTSTFLEEKLKILGLNDKEANEFIIYWLEKLEKNSYNYIRFETQEEIEEYMPLEIIPKPDTIIRILMDYMPLQEKIKVEEQHLIKRERKGFTVIEWGGSLVDK